VWLAMVQQLLLLLRLTLMVAVLLLYLVLVVSMVQGVGCSLAPRCCTMLACPLEQCVGQRRLVWHVVRACVCVCGEGAPTQGWGSGCHVLGLHGAGPGSG
jgi:hypothetical protein